MRERSDEALMKAFAGGSMEAFELLYERHRSGLYRYVLRKTGHTATANDLFQGVWEKLIRARAQYSPSVPFRAWLYRIAYNHVVDYFRRVRPALEMTEAMHESPEPGPDEQATLGERARRLERAIEQLPGQQREALLLKLEAGLDVAEIASVTGTNRETAKSRLRYATRKLKKMLMENPTGSRYDL